MNEATRQILLTDLFTTTYDFLTNQDEVDAVQAARIGLALRDLAESMLADAEVVTDRIRSLDEVLSR